MKYHVIYCDLSIYNVHQRSPNDTSNICQESVFAKNEAEAIQKTIGKNRDKILKSVVEMPPQPSSLRGAIEEEELMIVLECLEREKKRAKSIQDRPTQGYGKASEQIKKDNWGDKAVELELIINKLSEAFI